MASPFATIAKYSILATLLFITFIATVLGVFQFLPSWPLTDDEMLHPLKDVSLPYYAKYSKVDTADGITINVLQAQDPTITVDQPLMLFIHGFPESGLLSWHNQIGYFSNLGYNVIAPDLRGVNDSSKPSDPFRHKYSAFGDHTGDMVALLKHFLKNGTKATVVGHDWGGIISWALAGNYPDLIESLIILNAPHSGVRYTYSEWWESRQLFKSWYKFYFQLPYLPEHRALRGDSEFFLSFAGMNDLARQGHIGRPILDRYKQLFQSSISTSLNIYRSTFLSNILRKFIPNSFLSINKSAKSQVPTLVIAGKQDKYIHHLLFQKSFEQGIDQKVAPKSRIEYFDDATHWIHKEEPERVNESILNFLKSSGATLTHSIKTQIHSEQEKQQKQKLEQEERKKQESQMTPEELIIFRTEEAARKKLEQEEAKKHVEELKKLKEREEAAQIEAEHIKSKKLAEEKEKEEQRKLDLENTIKEHDDLVLKAAQEQLTVLEQERQAEHAQELLTRRFF